ncbi:MAG TPA: FkbM family methyltransferase [Candidatus Binatia bacterium]|nr:FkbM family methyltransferase [Candidatus Binatia bacterium]
MAFTGYFRGESIVYALKDVGPFVLHPYDRLSYSIYIENSYEPLETAVVKSVVRQGDSVIDCGASIGYYTALFARCTGPIGRVIAFEPAQATCEKLKVTVRRLGLEAVDVNQLAVSDRVEWCEFVLSLNGREAQQSFEEWRGVAGVTARVMVEATTLDQTFDERALYDVVSFVKCDVEGAEGKVVKGARKVLGSAHRPIFMVEVNQPALAATRAFAEDVVARFSDFWLYYTPLRDHSPGRRSETRLRRFTSVSDLPEISNLFAFPKEGKYADRLDALKRLGLI